jgi:hypothetical protein
MCYNAAVMIHANRSNSSVPFVVVNGFIPAGVSGIAPVARR